MEVDHNNGFTFTLLLLSAQLSFVLCFDLCSQCDFIVCVGELCWLFESALVLDSIHQWCQLFLLNSRDHESSRHWIPFSIYTASGLYTFCIFGVEVTNSFGVCHRVITDYVSCENLIDAQHRQDLDCCQ